MTGFYGITTTIKDALLEDEFVNTVSEGSENDVDIQKKTIFPLSHIMVGNVSHEDSALRFSITIILSDIVDKANLQTNDVFRGNDNTQDVLNTQLAVGVRLVERLRRGDLWTSEYQLDGEPQYESFTDRYENFLSGWVLTLDVLYQHGMTICDVPTSPPSCLPAYVKNTLDTQLAEVASGGTYEVTDSVISNSDDTYSVSVPAETDLDLPDTEININYGATTETITAPALTDININVTL